MLYRHGDVLVQSVERLPSAHPRPGATLARGEITGHSHRFSDAQRVQLYQAGAELYVEVLADHAALIHEEHHTFTLPRGVYKVWMQREYSPEAIRRVLD
ncbi:hypothetical protein [Deinococcus sp.]|uniref:hypothetical protein n=1 Tax=Deinococcus sp. TaxID=47478 RepID=UPI003B5A9C0B